MNTPLPVLNTAQIASFLLERRSTSMNPLVPVADLRAALGHAGFAEAINRRWLVADVNEGYTLNISDRADAIAAMKEAMSDPQTMDTGDEIQYVGQDGKVYTGVLRNVDPRTGKATIAFTHGNPPNYRDGEEYDTRDVKVTKKTAPDARKDPNDRSRPDALYTPPTSAPSSSPPSQTYQGFSR